MNAFAPKEKPIPLKPKETQPEPAIPGPQQSGGLSLPTPKPKRKQCSLYLEADMMDRIRRVAKKHGVTIAAVVETCVKAAIDQLEE